MHLPLDPILNKRVSRFRPSRFEPRKFTAHIIQASGDTDYSSKGRATQAATAAPPSKRRGVRSFSPLVIALSTESRADAAFANPRPSDRRPGVDGVDLIAGTALESFGFGLGCPGIIVGCVSTHVATAATGIDGQPARIHARSSSRRHRTIWPSRIGNGIFLASARRKTCRAEQSSMAATARALRSSAGDVSGSPAGRVTFRGDSIGQFQFHFAVRRAQRPSLFRLFPMEKKGIIPGDLFQRLIAGAHG